MLSVVRILSASALLATSLTVFVGPSRAAQVGDPLPGAAIGQTAQCQSVPKASDRLACYDRMNPPTALGKPAPTATGKPAKPPADQGQVVDMLAVENSKLDAKLKTICRGC